MILDLVVLMLLALWTIPLYLHSITSAFTFDDGQILNAAEEHQAARRQPRTEPRRREGWRKTLWRIQDFLSVSNRHVLWMSYARDLDAHGRQPEGWRLTNIAIQVVNVALVYALLRGIFTAQPSAILGGFLYAAHPLATGTVATLSGRSSALCAVFYLSGLIAAICGSFVLAVLFGFLAWKTKEEALMFPLVALATVYFWTP